MKTLLGAIVVAAIMVSGGAAWADSTSAVIRGSGQGDKAPVVVARTEVTLKVGGITCPACSYMVNQALNDVPGVYNVKLQATDDPAVIIAVVDCDQRLVSGEELAVATAGLGYPTEVIDDNRI